MSPLLRLLNLTAQGRVPLESARAWFDVQVPDVRSGALLELARMIHQAHPTREEVAYGVTLSGLRTTYTPCVMFTREPTFQTAYRIAQLPADEHAKAFAVMLRVFAEADARRRRTDCSPCCTHEWHNLPQDDDPLHELG